MAYIIGIILAVQHAHYSVALIGVGVALAVSLIVHFVFALDQLKGVAILFSFVSIGYAMTTFSTEHLSPKHYEQATFHTQNTEYFGKLRSAPLERSKTVKLELDLIQSQTIHDTQVVTGRILAYVEKDSNALELQLADVIHFRAMLGEIHEPLNPDAFDYRSYLALHQIHGQAFLKSDDWRLVQEGSGFQRSVSTLQLNALDQLIHSGVSEDALGVISALLLGFKHHLSLDQKEAFSDAGAMHVLAVSGLHVGIVFLLLSTLLKTFDRWRNGRLFRSIIILAALWFYATLTGLSPSVSRATTMFSFIIIGQVMNREGGVYNGIVASAFLLLIINPFLLYEVGFQLSYLAVIGIVYLQPKIYSWYQPKWKLLDRVWALMAVSIAAQLATFPLGLYYFHQFPNYFLLTNIVVVPAASIILPMGMMFLTLSWWGWFVSWFSGVLSFWVELLSDFVRWVGNLPYANLEGIYLSMIDMMLIYAMMALVIGFLVQKHVRWLQSSLLVMTLLLVSNVVQAYHRSGQRLLTFYSIRGHDVLDVIRGDAHVLIHDASLLSDDDAIRFNLQNHWWQRGLSAASSRSLDSLVNCSFIAEGQRVLVLSDSMHILEATDTDILWILERTMQHPTKVLELCNPKQVVLSRNLDWKSANYWERLCNEQQVPVHRLNEGALVISTTHE